MNGRMDGMGGVVGRMRGVDGRCLWVGRRGWTNEWEGWRWEGWIALGEWTDGRGGWVTWVTWVDSIDGDGRRERIGAVRCGAVLCCAVMGINEWVDGWVGGWIGG